MGGSPRYQVPDAEQSRRVRLLRASRLFERSSYVGPVSLVLGELLRQLGGGGGEEASLELARDGRVGAHARGEGEGEEVVGLGAEDRVGLRLRHRVVARHL